jgi:hypothetical protein
MFKSKNELDNHAHKERNTGAEKKRRKSVPKVEEQNSSNRT